MILVVSQFQLSVVRLIAFMLVARIGFAVRTAAKSFRNVQSALLSISVSKRFIAIDSLSIVTPSDTNRAFLELIQRPISFSARITSSGAFDLDMLYRRPTLSKSSRPFLITLQ